MQSHMQVPHLCSSFKLIMLNFLVPESAEIPQAKFIRAVRVNKHGLQ